MILKRKISLFLAFLLSFTFLFATINETNYSDAASTNIIKTLKERTNYYYDLDNNGKKEKIYYKQSYKDSTGKYTIYLYINGKLMKTKTAYSGLVYWDYKVTIYDFNKKDKYKEIAVELYDEMYNTYTGIMRYKSGKLTEYKIDPHNLRGAVNYSTIYAENIRKTTPDGYIHLEVRDLYGEKFMGNYTVEVKYKVDNNGVSKPSTYTFNTLNITKSNNYIAKNKMYAYTTTALSKKAFTISKGSKVKVYSMYKSKGGTVYLKVKNSSGKYGWIKVGSSLVFTNPNWMQ